MRLTTTVLLFLFSLSAFSQSILEEKPECDIKGSYKKDLFEILINFQRDILCDGDFLYDKSNIEIEARNKLLNNGATNTTFVIRYNEETITSASVLSKVRSAYKALEIPENSWKICYISKDEYRQLIPPPPPPPESVPTVIEIVDDEEEIEEELEIEDIELDEDTEIEIIEEEEELEDDTPFFSAEYMPGLGPCKDELDKDKRHQCTQMEIIKYVSKNTKYPPIAKDAGIQGTVYVYFVVGKDGNVRDVKILREVDPRLDKEAKRVVESLPKFEPGRQQGKNVSVQYTIPVKFIIR